ncbi:NUDIX domain-containing protein [Streptomyces smyrnaeus]|uniref:NUDIX domain-containing protein n=1 Tax=Streptomyces smyrnaeus TaxID=1387713 RepID=UPI0036739A23
MHIDHNNKRPGHRRIGALLLIRNPEGDVLLVKPSYRTHWQLVGGGVWTNELVPHAALREGFEEIKIADLEVGDLLAVDHIAANPASGAVEGLNFIFDGGVLPNDAPVILPDPAPGEEEPELTDWKFVPTNQLGDYCNPVQHSRICAALAALDDPSQRAYLAEGQPVTPYSKPRA